jgi:thiamine transporter ThiT
LEKVIIIVKVVWYDQYGIFAPKGGGLPFYSLSINSSAVGIVIARKF